MNNSDNPELVYDYHVVEYADASAEKAAAVGKLIEDQVEGAWIEIIDPRQWFTVRIEREGAIPLASALRLFLAQGDGDYNIEGVLEILDEWLRWTDPDRPTRTSS